MVLANFRPIAMTSSTPARCQEHLFCTRLKLAHTTATWCYFLLDHSNAKLFTNTFCATNMELPIVGSTNLDPNCSKQNTNIAWFFGWNRRLSMLKVSGWSRCARIILGGWRDGPQSVPGSPQWHGGFCRNETWVITCYNHIFIGMF